MYNVIEINDMLYEMPQDEQNKWLHKRDASQSLEDIIQLIYNEHDSRDKAALRNLFFHAVNTPSDRCSPFTILGDSDNTIYQCLDRIFPLKNEELSPFSLPKYIIFDIIRNYNNYLYYKLDYGMILDLSNYNIRSEVYYKLHAVIAYLDSPPHYSILVNKGKNKWLWIDDINVYLIEYDIPFMLRGGKEINNFWREKTGGKKWISKILIYKRIKKGKYTYLL